VLYSVQRDIDKSALWREKLANETAAQRQARLQQMSDYQQEGIALPFSDCALVLRLASTMIIICLVYIYTISVT